MYPKDTNVLVSVDIELVLETLQLGLTRIGEWINVVGYVLDGSSKAPDAVAHVQALMVWETGPLDIQQYERAVEDELGSGSG